MINDIKKNMNKSIHKIKIARAFGTASNSYDISARLQRFSGKNLMRLLPQESSIKSNKTVLDLGSGTGFFTDILAEGYATVIGLDLSKQMLQFAKKSRSENITWLEADAHKMPLQNNSVDLIYSNLVIQWCDPLDVLLQEILRILKPGGSFVFSTLTEGTLFELKSSWAQVDDEQHVINFKSEAQLQQLLNSSQSTLVENKCQDIVLEYENVLHLARELKALGANYVSSRHKGLAGKDKWFKMSESYKDFIEPNGVYPATYRVFSGKIVKKMNQ